MSYTLLYHPRPIDSEIELQRATRDSQMNEDNLTDYYADFLAFICRDLSHQVETLIEVVDMIVEEREEAETVKTQAQPIPEEELMVTLLLFPLIFVYPDLLDQIRILEGLQRRLAESSASEPSQSINEDSKLDRFLRGWCNLESDDENRDSLVREALIRQCMVLCWP